MLIKTTQSTSMLSATAVALLMAACGNGSGSDGAAGTRADGALAPRAATGSSAQTPAADTPTTPGADTTTPGGSATATRPITEAGISTALFEKILKTQTAYVRQGPHIFPISYHYRAEQMLEINPDGTESDLSTWNPDPDLPAMLAYQDSSAGRFVVHSWGADRTRAADGKIMSAVASFAYELHEGATDRRMTLKPDAEVKAGYSRDSKTGAEQYRETNALKAEGEKVIPRDGVLPFDQDLQMWASSGGRAEPDADGVLDDGHLAMIVRKGDAADQVQLCLDINSQRKLRNPESAPPELVSHDVQRRVCSVWQVPANWTPSQSLVYHGIVVDEDSSYEGTSVFGAAHRWKTRPWQERQQAEAARPAGAAGAPQAAEAVEQTRQAASTAAGDDTPAATAAEVDATHPNAVAATQDAKPVEVTPAAGAAAPAADVPAQPGASAPATDAATRPAAPAADATVQPGAAAPAADAAAPAADAAGTPAPAAGDAATPAADAARPADDAAARPAADAATPAADAARPAADAAAQPGAADTARPSAELPSTTPPAAHINPGSAESGDK